MTKTIAAIIALTLAAPAATQTSDGIAGRWRTDDGKAVITIAPCTAGAATLCGRISRLLVAEPAGGARDANNPNRALRTRLLVGVAILSNLARNGAAWSGRGYDPEGGRNFNATVRRDGARLSMRGCVALFCRTVVWTRAS